MYFLITDWSEMVYSSLQFTSECGLVAFQHKVIIWVSCLVPVRKCTNDEGQREPHKYCNDALILKREVVFYSLSKISLQEAFPSVQKVVIYHSLSTTTAASNGGSMFLKSYQTTNGSCYPLLLVIASYQDYSRNYITVFCDGHRHVYCDSYLYLYKCFDRSPSCRHFGPGRMWSPRQVTHLSHVWDLLLPLAYIDTR